MPDRVRASNNYFEGDYYYLSCNIIWYIYFRASWLDFWGTSSIGSCLRILTILHPDRYTIVNIHFIKKYILYRPVIDIYYY